jgi:hypothetical protein
LLREEGIVAGSSIDDGVHSGTPYDRRVHRLLLLLDPVVVVAFVAIGRDTHDEAPTLGGLMVTAAPFLIALAAGWLAARAWRDPAGIPTGAVVAAVTLVLGMALRRTIFDEGTAVAFVVVATLFLGIAMLGWRAIAGRFLADRAAA